MDERLATVTNNAYTNPRRAVFLSISLRLMELLFYFAKFHGQTLQRMASLSCCNSSKNDPCLSAFR